jgi:hypothetical protein
MKCSEVQNQCEARNLEALNTSNHQEPRKKKEAANYNSYFSVRHARCLILPCFFQKALCQNK